MNGNELKALGLTGKAIGIAQKIQVNFGFTEAEMRDTLPAIIVQPIAVQTQRYCAGEKWLPLGAVADGLGVGQFLSYMVEPLVRSGALRLILRPYEPPAVPVTMIYPHSRLLSTKVRLFIDGSAPRLRSLLLGSGKALR